MFEILQDVNKCYQGTEIKKSNYFSLALLTKQIESTYKFLNNFDAAMFNFDNDNYWKSSFKLCTV